MSQRLIATVSVWLLASVVLGAAKVWESKPFTAWTDAELKWVLTDSPWSGKARFSPKTGARGYPTEGLVTWSSARVMRQAQVRRQQLGVADKAVAAHLQAVVDEAPDRYVVTLRISRGETPGVFARRDLAMAMVRYTLLTRHGKPPIGAERVESVTLDEKGAKVAESPSIADYKGRPERSDAFGDGGDGFLTGPASRYTSVIVFYFPKTDPIRAMDQEVEFLTRLLNVDGTPVSYVRKTFRLKDMTVNGELQL